MILSHSFRALFHFWDFGGVLFFLIPAIFAVAVLLQLFLFRGLKRPWLPIVVCGGVLLLCDILASITIAVMERNGLGVAFVGMVVDMLLLSAILGLAIGLPLGLLRKKKSV